MKYHSLAEVIDIVKSAGFKYEDEIRVATVMFSAAFIGLNAQELKSFTGFDSEVDSTLDRMAELGMIDEDGKGIIAEWAEKDHGDIAFAMDVYGVMGYLIVGYREDGERTYRANPDKPSPLIREMENL